MNRPDPDFSDAPARSAGWVRMLCFVLLTATLLNYANRFAFTQNALPIQEEFETNEEGYGDVAGWFSLGFAFGGLLFGILADKISVRWLYPVVVLVWSAAGISSGLVTTLVGLSVSQFVLGLFEAGHWPCALRTTQRAFRPSARTWGNSILQSGASLGAVGTPLLVALLYAWNPAQWRWAFFLVGGLGLFWAIWWLSSISEDDLRRPVIQTDESGAGLGEERELVEVPFYRLFLTRRWWLLLVIVVCINTLWHYIRVWMPVTLEKDYEYDHAFVAYFTSAYYLATFFGSLVSGWLTAWLPARGWNVHRARLAVFLGFGLLASLAVPAAAMHRGPLLLGTLLLIAFGSLGLFPIYYSLNQELSAKNQGKVGGTLSFATWGILYYVHPAVGKWVDQDPTIRPYLFAAFGLGPLLAFVVLALFWGKRPTE
jgi:ACS family hexuronate transporter-like MFS transporter